MNIIDVHSEINIEKRVLNKIKELCSTLLSILKISNWELSVVLCDDDFIRKLNKTYRGKDEPTDVLSFSQIEDNIVKNNSHIHAGDIIISLETLKKNCSEFNIDINEEFKRLLIHGILHLQGYTHEESSPDNEMLENQEKIVAETTGVKIF